MNMKNEDVDWRQWVFAAIIIVLIIGGYVWWAYQTPVVAH